MHSLSVEELEGLVEGGFTGPFAGTRRIAFRLPKGLQEGIRPRKRPLSGVLVAGTTLDPDTEFLDLAVPHQVKAIQPCCRFRHTFLHRRHQHLGQCVGQVGNRWRGDRIRLRRFQPPREVPRPSLVDDLQQEPIGAGPEYDLGLLFLVVGQDLGEIEDQLSVVPHLHAVIGNDPQPDAGLGSSVNHVPGVHRLVSPLGQVDLLATVPVRTWLPADLVGPEGARGIEAARGGLWAEVLRVGRLGGLCGERTGRPPGPVPPRRFLQSLDQPCFPLGTLRPQFLADTFQLATALGHHRVRLLHRLDRPGDIADGVLQLFGRQQPHRGPRTEGGVVSIEAIGDRRSLVGLAVADDPHGLPSIEPAFLELGGQAIEQLDV